MNGEYCLKNKSFEHIKLKTFYEFFVSDLYYINIIYPNTKCIKKERSPRTLSWKMFPFHKPTIISFKQHLKYEIFKEANCNNGDLITFEFNNSIYDIINVKYFPIDLFHFYLNKPLKNGVLWREKIKMENMNSNLKVSIKNKGFIIINENLEIIDFLSETDQNDCEQGAVTTLIYFVTYCLRINLRSKIQIINDNIIQTEVFHNYEIEDDTLYIPRKDFQITYELYENPQLFHMKPYLTNCI